MRTLPVISPDSTVTLAKIPFSRIILEEHAGALTNASRGVCRLCEREVYTKRPPKAKGAIRPEKKNDKFGLMRNGLLRGLRDRSMSWAPSRPLDLPNPQPLRPAFIVLEAGSIDENI